MNPGRRRRARRRRVQRVDKSNPADPRLGIGSTVDVRSTGRSGHPAPTAEETAAGRPAAREGGQLVG